MEVLMLFLTYCVGILLAFIVALKVLKIVVYAISGAWYKGRTNGQDTED